LLKKAARPPAGQHRRCEPTENLRPLARLRFGRFTGPWRPELASRFLLVCRPTWSDRPLYLVAHHGGADAGDAASFAGMLPNPILSTTARGKAGNVRAPQARGLEDAWQLHRSLPPG
jgi:hypothetical protein